MAEITELFEKLDEAMLIPDPRQRREAISELRKEAKTLRCATDFSAEVKRLESVMKDGNTDIKNVCDVSFLPEELADFTITTGEWLVDASGIYRTDWRSGNRYYAALVPVFPVERLQNMEDGTERIRIKFYRDYGWHEIIVDKSVTSSASKIVNLSDRGLPVDSEKAKYLVQFLNQFEIENADAVNRQKSTRKLGWSHDNKCFTPYDNTISFDGDEFKPLFDSIRPEGSAEVWKEEMKRIRRESTTEVKIMIVAGYASVLLSRMEILPFFIDLHGETEGGKTVTLKAVASIWANPDNDQFLGNFMATDVSIEVKASVLNHLPLLLDDSANLSRGLAFQDGKGLENLIYEICSGAGKSRSNKSLGITKEKTWRLIAITNGEHPLTGESAKGGAVNRVIEVECGNDYIFPDPQRACEIFSRNYGHSGKEFVSKIDDTVIERLKVRRKEFEKQIYSSDVMQKQSISVSFLLAVDELIDELIFHDGQTLDIEAVKKCMTSRSQTSESARAYEYLMDYARTEIEKFSESEYARGAMYGRFEEIDDDEEYLCIVQSRLVEVLKSGGYEKNQFLKFLKKNDLLVLTDSGKDVRQERGFLNRARYYKIVVLHCSVQEHMHKLSHENEVFGFDSCDNDEIFV